MITDQVTHLQAACIEDDIVTVRGYQQYTAWLAARSHGGTGAAQAAEVRTALTATQKKKMSKRALQALEDDGEIIRFVRGSIATHD